MSHKLAIVLASASPRRRELLAALSINFKVYPAAIDEWSDEPDPTRRATSLALAKARTVGAKKPDALVIGADTIVVAPSGEILGKPANAAAARAMLRALRGHTHHVLTGVAVVHEDQTSTTCVTTSVAMRDYADVEVEHYVARKEPFDKAGGYAIQDPNFAPATSATGCICSVIGLPLWSVRRLLSMVGSTVAPIPNLDRCASCPLRDSPATTH